MVMKSTISPRKIYWLKNEEDIGLFELNAMHKTLVLYSMKFFIPKANKLCVLINLPCVKYYWQDLALSWSFNNA